MVADWNASDQVSGSYIDVQFMHLKLLWSVFEFFFGVEMLTAFQKP
jgi:hypothetical protein